MAGQMKAFVIRGPRETEWTDVPVPQYGEDEVLIRVSHLGVCATDLEIYQGKMVYFLNGQSKYPIIPGHEWSGEVVAMGSGVKNVAVGDRVVGETTISCGRCKYCLTGRYNLCPHRVENGVLGKNGAGAEFLVYPAHALHRFSERLSFEEAAFIEPAAVAYRGVKKLKISPDDKVAVIGAGPIGLLSMQMAKAFGARYVALVDVRENRLKTGMRLGADEVLDLSRYKSVEEMLSCPPEERFTAVIEATGNAAAVETILDYAAPAAKICLLGLCGGHTARVDVDKLVTYDLELHGSLSSPGVWEAVIGLMESGKIRVKELISHRFSLKEMEKAFLLMEQKDPEIVKILLEI